MKWIETSVHRPIGVLMIVIAVVLIGGMALTNLAVDLYPDFKVPIAVVATSYPGAAPQEVEKLVSKPLEGSVGTLEGIKSIRSISSPESSLIILEFEWGTNLDSKMLDLREKVDMIKGFLPEDAEDPNVLRIDPQAIPIMRLSVAGDIDPYRLTKLTEDVIQPRLERTEGVAQVSLIGDKQEEIKVEIASDKLNHYGIAMSTVIQTLGSENVASSAGTVESGSQELRLRINGEYEDIQDIQKTLIPLPYGGTIKLEEIAHVEKTFKEDQTIAKMDGQPSLSIDISKKSDGNTVAVANNIDKTLEEIKPLLPEGVSIEPVYDLSIYIRQAINNVVGNMEIGGILATAILLLFLRNIRATIVIAVAMPIAIISTFTLLYFTGETLNMLTLGGLALGIGMMVDSSIVILENIYRYREEGYGLKEAAVEGAKEVSGAVVASTLTTVVVFIPIVFVQGMAAEIFRPLAITITFSLLASLITAILLVPMLSAQFLKNVGQETVQGRRKYGVYNLTAWFERFMNKVTEGYRNSIKWSLFHRKTVVIGTAVLILLSLFLIPMIGTEFIPAGDTGEINIDVTMPVGTSLSETERLIDEIATDITEIKEVDVIFSSAGNAGTFSFGGNDSHIGNLYVRLKPLAERERTVDQVMEEIRGNVKNIAGAEIKVTALDSGGGMSSGSPIQVNIRGFDLEVLEDLAFIVEEEIRQVEGTRNVENSLGEGRPEIQVIINRDIAAQYGLTFPQVMSTVKTAFEGQTATRYRIDGKEIDVVVTLPEEEKGNIPSLKHLTLLTPTGAKVPLTEVAELKQVEGPAQITRTDQQREVSVTSDILGRDLGSISKDIQDRVSKIRLPEGYFISYGGQAQDAQESFQDLGLALILSIFLVYMVMAVQFEALLNPLVIMFSMPATVIGVILGLVLMRETLSMPAYIGIIMLAGIVVNNAIVLVDYINILRKRGVERNRAVMDAGANRLRPILMTTLTTILALLPLMFFGGEGSETQIPFATVVFFGLSFSTLITLVLVPVVYTLFDEMEAFFREIATKEGRRRRKERKRKSREATV